MPYRRYRRRRRRPTRRWRHRRWTRYFRYRHRRPYRRRRRYKVRRRRIKKAPVIQWFPPTIRNCFIKGIWPLSYGHWLRTCLPMRKENGLIFLGGGIDWTVWTLQNLFNERLNWRNVWTASNDGMEFARFRYAKFKFFRHEFRSYIVTWDQDIPCKPLPYTNLHPMVMLLKKQHKVVLSKQECNPRKKDRPVTLKIRPPPKLTSQWRLSRELAKTPLLRLGFSLIDFKEPWLEGYGNAFYSTLGYEAHMSNQKTSEWCQCKYFWIYDSGVGNHIYVVMLQKDAEDNPGNLAAQSNTIEHIEQIGEGYPYWLFFFGRSERDLKALATTNVNIRNEFNTNPNSKKLKIGIIGWVSSNSTAADSSQGRSQPIQSSYRISNVLQTSGHTGGAAAIDNLWLNGWPNSQNYPPLNKDKNNLDFSKRGLCILRNNMKLGQQPLDDETTMFSLFGPLVEKANWEGAESTIQLKPELKDYNILMRYNFRFQWGGHGTETFKTSIGDPSTIPCPYGPGEAPQHLIRDPSKVHEGVLNAWDYDYDGIVRKDTLKKLLEIPTDSEEEKAYPLLGPKTERLPSSDESGESDISSSSDSSKEESEEEKRYRRRHKPTKRRLLQHVQRLVKRFRTL
uniref:Capsid protein n=1 Tax=Torque teno sus virus k2a TaxID=1968861 RepID=A0A385FPR5_9VIRU|nr:ORF1 [Torque teno sus virus k2a]